MTHDEQLLLQAYMDGELDAMSALAIDRRLLTEPALAVERDRLLALRRVLREGVVRVKAPDHLLASLAALGTSPQTAAPAALRRAAQRRLAGAFGPDWRLALAACVVSGLAGAALMGVLQPPHAPAPIMAEVVADHLRAVMAPQPFDVASSDQHTVKPWFTGRLNFAPRVFDLASDGFALTGGRVDVLASRPAATLVFRRGKHLISLTSQPVGDVAVGDQDGTHDRGFLVRSWVSGDMHYWAVSDVAPDELDIFEKLAKATLAKES